MAEIGHLIKIEGIVEEALPGLLFRVRSGEREILAHLAGRLKIHRIRIIPGDKVTIEMAGPNEKRGRIVRRL